MLVIRQNPFTGKVNTRDLDITDEQVAAYEAGALVQNAFQISQQTIASFTRLASTTGTRYSGRPRWQLVHTVSKRKNSLLIAVQTASKRCQ